MSNTPHTASRLKLAAWAAACIQVRQRPRLFLEDPTQKEGSEKMQLQHRCCNKQLNSYSRSCAYCCPECISRSLQPDL